MNPSELVDHIRSGPAELVLDKPLRFRRRTRSNPCDFNDFLKALQSSKTIRAVQCRSQLRLSITEDEWVLLVKTLGSIKDIHHLEFFCTHGSSRFRPFQAIAEAVKRAHSLRQLEIGVYGESLPRDPSGLTAFDNNLREHTTLEEFTWHDLSLLLVAQDFTTDFLLRALPACPQLRRVSITTEYASAGAMQNLLQLHEATSLRLILGADHWLAVADEIRQGRCNVQTLILTMLPIMSEATEAVVAVASAIRLDRNLKHLTLEMEDGFTDEAGVVLAEALTVNKTLRKISLSVNTVFDEEALTDTDELGAPAFEAFSAMLRVNTNLVLQLPPLESAGSDRKPLESHDQMVIEQRLNEVGRGKLLASKQTTKEKWVDALCDLNSSNVNDPPALRVSCLYSLLLLNPSVVSMS
jgi:hypothetical protein